MKARAAKLPASSRTTLLTEAVERLVQLCEAWGQKDKADTWRKELEALRPPAKKVKP